MKKMSIQKKVSSLTVRVSLVSVIVIGLIAIAGLWILRDNADNISGQLGEAASEDSRTALEERMVDRLETLVKNNASYSDFLLMSVQNSVMMLADAADDITQNPENYAPVPIYPPIPANAGIMTAQFVWAEGTDLPSVEGEAALMGNIQNLMLNIADNYKNYKNLTYVGSKHGYAILADASSDQRSEIFDPRERPWYKQALENNGLTWTNVYFSVNLDYGISCAMPYYDDDGNIAGIVGHGIDLTYYVTHISEKTKAGETGYTFLLNEFGQPITTEKIEVDENGDIILEDLRDSDNIELAAAAHRMIEGKTGVDRILMDEKEYFIAYTPLEILPWSLVTVVEVDEVVAPALESKERIVAMTNKAIRDIDIIIYTIVIIFATVIALSILLIGWSSKRFAAALTEPIMGLREGVQEIAGGNLEYIIDIRTGDEIEDLGLSVNKMTLDLKAYIANLQTVTAEKERIGAELDVATRIQANMLPCIFPAFPGRSEFDIYASMTPAKEVGGDFYDFFLIDSNTLAVVIADVSGKGVPAALFMVIAKTLIKNNAQSGKSPSEVFETANNMLCENNDANMFVTVFMGYLDIPSGRFTYVNAGHNPPLLRSGGGRFDWLRTDSGLMLAYMEDMGYEQGEITMRPDDELFMYTDGVTEAMNNENKLFGDPRLLETANRHADLTPQAFAAAIKDEIDKFAVGAEQADDITMLALRYRGNPCLAAIPLGEHQ